MKVLHLDVSTGAAGDMLSAALLELFDDRDTIVARLNAIGVPGVAFRVEAVTKHGVSGTHLRVLIRGEEEGKASHPHHVHRRLSDVEQIIDALNLPENVKTDVKAVYRRIAAAESAVHGEEVGAVHFHELGMMDAIADVAAACLLMDLLAVDRVTATPVCTGFGEIRCAHGALPVPAPATARLLEGVPSFAGDLRGELCTPTGAALVGHFAAAFTQQPLMTVEKTGCGMGQKEFSKLSVVRAVLGDVEETIVELSCNVDDMSPEAVGFAIAELLRLGAPDAYYTPIGMKKNRPGVMLTCLCRESQRDEMVRAIFRHTTTIGVRETLCRRYVLRRHEEIQKTAYGPVRIKVSEGHGAARRKAEFDDLARIARDHDLTLREAEAMLYE